MQIIKSIFCFIVCICLLFLGIENTFAEEVIILPEASMCNADISNCVHLFPPVKSHKQGVYPEQISFDIFEKKVKGLIATYDKSVNFSNVEKAINKLYAEWEVESLNDKNVDVRVWRVQSLRFVIQLSKNDENRVQVILLPFSKKR